MTSFRAFPSLSALALGLALAAPAFAADSPLMGANEVPPVETAAAGMATISIAKDGMVSGMVKTTGINATMAHIHMAPAGQNGPVIVPLTKVKDDTWGVPSTAKLTPDQMAAFLAGNLYVNVHSEAHPGGEIRVQLKP